MSKVRNRLTYANVMATVAVFIALGGGAYAVSLQKNSVKSKHIKDGQVKSADVADDDLIGTDIDEDTLQLSRRPGRPAWPEGRHRQPRGPGTSPGPQGIPALPGSSRALPAGGPAGRPKGIREPRPEQRRAGERHQPLEQHQRQGGDCDVSRRQGRDRLGRRAGAGATSRVTAPDSVAEVVISGIDPAAASVRVRAFEPDAYEGSWMVTAKAICADVN